MSVLQFNLPDSVKNKSHVNGCDGIKIPVFKSRKKWVYGVHHRVLFSLNLPIGRTCQNVSHNHLMLVCWSQQSQGTSLSKIQVVNLCCQFRNYCLKKTIIGLIFSIIENSRGESVFTFCIKKGSFWCLKCVPRKCLPE